MLYNVSNCSKCQVSLFHRRLTHNYCDSVTAADCIRTVSVLVLRAHGILVDRTRKIKLVRVINGEVFDVAIDLRKGSDTFGKHYGILLSAENKKQFFVPKGFAHGFLVVSDYAEFCYKVTDFYHPNDEGGLMYNDPDIGIEWPFSDDLTEADLILSDKDKVNQSFKDYCAGEGMKLS